MKKVKNWFELFRIRFFTVRKAVIIRKLSYRIGGSCVQHWSKDTCPKHKHFLWKLYQDAGSAIYNANWEICTIFFNKPYVNTVKGCEMVEGEDINDTNIYSCPDNSIPMMATRYAQYDKNSYVQRLCRLFGGSAMDAESENACPWHLRKLWQIYNSRAQDNTVIAQEISAIYLRDAMAMNLT